MANDPIRRELTREREDAAWELCARGLTQASIAVKLGLSQSGVSRLLRRAESRALARLFEDVDTCKVRQLAQLGHVVELALDGYNASLEPKRKAIKRRIPDGEPSEISEIVEAVADGAGNPKFLQVVLDALREERAIIGEVEKRMRARRSQSQQLEDLLAWRNGT